MLNAQSVPVKHIDNKISASDLSTEELKIFSDLLQQKFKLTFNTDLNPTLVGKNIEDLATNYFNKTIFSFPDEATRQTFIKRYNLKF
jgi:hypothetical protein